MKVLQEIPDGNVCNGHMSCCHYFNERSHTVLCDRHRGFILGGTYSEGAKIYTKCPPCLAETEAIQNGGYETQTMRNVHKAEMAFKAMAGAHEETMRMFQEAQNP